MVKALIFLRWLNVGLILVTLVAYLSPYIDPNTFWPPAIVALFYPWLLLANLLFIVLWAVQRRWYALFSLGCILVGAGHVRATMGISTSAAAPENATVLQVSTFNCHGFQENRREESYVEEEDLIPFLKEQSPDVLCLQEFPVPSRIAEKYIGFLLKHSGLPYYYKKGELCVFSRYPLENPETHLFANGVNGYQEVDLKIAGQLVRLYNVHLQSNAITRLSERVTEHGDLQDRETWQNVRGMLARYRRSAALRARQAEDLAREITDSPYPVLLCGDFNDVPLSHVYQQLSAGLTDSFKKRGGGLSVTYSGNLPGLRIDYILVDPRIDVLQERRGQSRFSDHRPVWTRIALPEKTKR